MSVIERETYIKAVQVCLRVYAPRSILFVTRAPLSSFSASPPSPHRLSLLSPSHHHHHHHHHPPSPPLPAVSVRTASHTHLSDALRRRSVLHVC